MRKLGTDKWLVRLVQSMYVLALGGDGHVCACYMGSVVPTGKYRICPGRVFFIMYRDRRSKLRLEDRYSEAKSLGCRVATF